MADVKTARAIVVDTRPLFSKAIREWLEKGGPIILAQVQNLDEAIHQIDAVHPNLVIIGPALAEHSLVACRKIITSLPVLKVIIFAAHADALFFQVDTVHAGVAACVRQEITNEELLEVIAKVMAGVGLFPHEILSVAFQPIDLTEREHDVLRLMANGKSNRETANALNLKFNTVRNQQRQIKHVAVPPQHNARIWQHGNLNVPPHPCDENLRRIRAIGRTPWKIETRYHQRSLGEHTFFQFKTIFGEKL